MDSSNMSTTSTLAPFTTRNITFSPNNTLHNTTGPTSPNLVVLTYVGILVCIITFALMGNLVVIIVFLIDRKLRVSSSYYIFSLAVADVITAALVMTFEVDQYLHDGKWRYSKALCKAWTTAYLFTVPVSILTTCLSSIDRWYAISRPLQYRTNRNGLKHKALVAIMLIWIYSILFALVPEFGWNPPGDSHGIPENSQYCFFDIYLEYSILSSVLHFILPSLVTAFFYYNMFKAMKSHTTHRRKMSSGSDYSHARCPSQKNQRKGQRINFRYNVSLAKSYALIGSLLILTWCPHSILSIMQNTCVFKNSRSYGCGYILDINEQLLHSLLLLGYFNSALNPIVYVLRFRQFRLTLMECITCKKH